MARKLVLLLMFFLFLILSDAQEKQNNSTESLISNNQINKQQSIQLQQYIQTENNSTENIEASPSIFGVRWFLGDYFSYVNLVKTHPSYIKPQQYPQNSNYYVLAFNSETKIQQGLFLEIAETVHACSYTKISIPFSKDHSYVLSPNNQTNSTDSHIYKCNVNMDLRRVGKSLSFINQNLLNFQEYPYKIFRYLGINNKHLNDEKNKKLSYQIISRQYLYNCTFRAPLPKLESQQKINLNSIRSQYKIQSNILVFGDWSVISKQTQQNKSYIPIVESVISRIQSDKNLIMVIFLGDLAYDFVSNNYFITLKFIQPLTSRICFMATPGNHQYSYHADSFEIFAQTFLTPQWSKYYNIYSTFVLGDYLFISYQPQNTAKKGRKTNVKPLQYMLSQFYDEIKPKNPQNNPNLNSQPKQVLEKASSVSDKYHVIVFSHYPVICSKLNDSSQSCTQNKVRLKSYLKTFTDIGMDLYLSAHVHYYDRTHSLCWKPQQQQFQIEKPTDIEMYNEGNEQINKQIYQSKCPTYIVQGAGGNQYFVQEQNAFKPLQISSKIAFKTGYGILKLISELGVSNNKKRKQITNKIQFTHYKMIKRNQSILFDKFTKILPLLSHNYPLQNKTIDNQQQHYQQKHNQQKNNQQDNIKNKTHKNNSDEQKIFLGKVIIGSFFSAFIIILIFVLMCKKIRQPIKQEQKQKQLEHKSLHEQNQGPKSDAYIARQVKN